MRFSLSPPNKKRILTFLVSFAFSVCLASEVLASTRAIQVVNTGTSTPPVVTPPVTPGGGGSGGGGGGGGASGAPPVTTPPAETPPVTPPSAPPVTPAPPQNPPPKNQAIKPIPVLPVKPPPVEELTREVATPPLKPKELTPPKGIDDVSQYASMLVNEFINGNFEVVLDIARALFLAFVAILRPILLSITRIFS